MSEGHCRPQRNVPHDLFMCHEVSHHVLEYPFYSNNLFKLVESFISNELLERIAQCTNDWFQVKKASGPNQHKAPKTKTLQ